MSAAIPSWSLFSVLGAITVVLIVSSSASGGSDRWSCQVLPPEREVTQDTQSGAKVVFVTRHGGVDRNLYFHERSWLADGSMLVFHSDRTGHTRLYGYLEATGELVQMERDGVASLGSVTCSRKGTCLYGTRGSAIFAWSVEIGTANPSAVTVRERKVGDLPRNGGSTSNLTENMDGRLLAVAYRDADKADTFRIAAIDAETGALISVVRVDFAVYHLQFSWTHPDLLMFARAYPDGDRMSTTAPAEQPHCRMWLVDLSGRPPRPVHPQRPGELATHECWWTEDRLTFCGGYHVPEESHVKVVDTKTGRVSIIGAGNWWPEGSPDQIKHRAWWHAAGSPDGRWVVADNFYGDIALFDGMTTEERIMTSGHRKLGESSHPHPGWAPSSDRVVFTSTRRGNPDVVIVYVPKSWR